MEHACGVCRDSGISQCRDCGGTKILKVRGGECTYCVGGFITCPCRTPRRVSGHVAKPKATATPERIAARAALRQAKNDRAREWYFQRQTERAKRLGLPPPVRPDDLPPPEDLPPPPAPATPIERVVPIRAGLTFPEPPPEKSSAARTRLDAGIAPPWKAPPQEPPQRTLPPAPVAAAAPRPTLRLVPPPPDVSRNGSETRVCAACHSVHLSVIQTCPMTGRSVQG